MLPLTKPRVRGAWFCWLYGVEVGVLTVVLLLEAGAGHGHLGCTFQIRQTSDYHAWTNSPTEIYIASKADEKDGLLLVVLYHEACHVMQFNAAGSMPPATYTKMVEYELVAYPNTAMWARAHTDPDVKQWASALDDATAWFRKLRDDVERKAPKDGAKREDLYKTALLKHGKLPKDTEIADLYLVVPEAKKAAPTRPKK